MTQLVKSVRVGIRNGPESTQPPLTKLEEKKKKRNKGKNTTSHHEVSFAALSILFLMYYCCCSCAVNSHNTSICIHCFLTKHVVHILELGLMFSLPYWTSEMKFYFWHILSAVLFFNVIGSHTQQGISGKLEGVDVLLPAESLVLYSMKAITLLLHNLLLGFFVN